MTREFEARGGPIIFMNQKRIRLSPEVAAVVTRATTKRLSPGSTANVAPVCL